MLRGRFAALAAVLLAADGPPEELNDKTSARWRDPEAAPIGILFTLAEDDPCQRIAPVRRLHGRRPGGNLWFGHAETGGGGVCRYDGKSFTHVTEKDGLCGNNVYCILEDRAGHLWFGTLDAGVCRYDGKSFTNHSGK